MSLGAKMMCVSIVVIMWWASHSFLVAAFIALIFFLKIYYPEEEVRYGCPPDYKQYNRNKDFLDE